DVCSSDLALADGGLVAVGEGRYEVVSVGVHGGRDDLVVAGVRAPVTDVLGHAAGEQQRLLRDDAYVRAQLLEVELPQVDPVQCHASSCRVMEARDEADQRALAGAARPTMATNSPARASRSTPTSTSSSPRSP